MKGFWTAPVLGVVGGLVLLLAGAAGWVDATESREVGGVTVTEPVSISGTTYAPAVVAIGLGALVGGALLAVVRGGGRRVLGVGLAVIGVAGLVALGRGVAAASAVQGTLTPAPFLGAFAALAVMAAGVAAARGPGRPPAVSRYRVEGEQPGDDEWTLAAGEDDAST